MSYNSTKAGSDINRTDFDKFVMDFHLAMEDSNLFTMTEQNSSGFGVSPSFQPTIYRAHRYSHGDHDAQSCRGSVCTVDLEKQILRHPEVSTQLEAISLCLRLPIVLLKSLHALRTDEQHHDDLQSVYGQLFTTPSSDLFNLVHMLRIFPHYDPTKLIERLQLAKDFTSPNIKSKSEAGRTAPDGYKYVCPSLNCFKDFSKSGHAQNHLKKYHPEYLQLHPDYEPKATPVDLSRSQSTSPELDRHRVRKHESRTGRHSRSVTSNAAGLAMTLGDDSFLTPSPRGPSFDFEEQLTSSPSNGRPSPRQPATPQSVETNFSGDRHGLPLYLSPNIGMSVKRNRDSDSSYDRLEFDVDTLQPRHGRRPSKRFSMSNGYWQA